MILFLNIFTLCVNKIKNKMIELKFLILSFLVFLNSKIARCSLEINATNLELTIGLCVNKFPASITYFDFYFSYENLTSFKPNNYSGLSDQASSNSCSASCCSENNTSKLKPFIKIKINRVIKYYSKFVLVVFFYFIFY